MHKLGALRRVFHSASRTNAVLQQKSCPEELPSLIKAPSSPTSAQSTVAPGSRDLTSSVERRRSSTDNSILYLESPVLPHPLAEPVKASPSPSRIPSNTRALSFRPKPDSTDSNEHGSFCELIQERRKRTDHKPRYERREGPIFVVKPTIRSFELVKTVGTGSFGRVFMAKIRDRRDAAPVAIKRITKAAVLKQKQVDHVLSEKAILARMYHPFLVKMHATFQDARYLYIVMEYIEGGEFFTFLRRYKRLEDDSARFYAAHVTLIFEYLHSMSIVYRDLKPENLLISRHGYLKLTDFGFAKLVERRTFTLCGTPEYIAPEVLLNKGHGKPVDWWTLGILIYEMIVGYPPFFDEDVLGIYQKILAGKIVFPRFFQKDARSLVKRLLTHDLARRYGHLRGGQSDVRQHKWFEEMDFDALLARTLPPPYKPPVKALDDTSNFGEYDEPQDEDELPAARDVDPFVDW